MTEPSAEPTSYYLSDEAEAFRRSFFFKRILGEAIDLGPAGRTWPEDSDFWLLPERVRKELTHE